jgi:RNA recognition motif-containing protein
MGNRIYVGNISYNTTEETLRQVFSEEGRIVKKVMIITDKETNRPRGFAFVIMDSDSDAQKAIKILDGREVDGRSLRINEAKERESSGPSGYIRSPDFQRTPSFQRSPVRNEPAPQAPPNLEEFPDLVPKNAGRPSRDFGPPRFAGSNNWDKKKSKRGEDY